MKSLETLLTPRSIVAFCLGTVIVLIIFRYFQVITKNGKSWFIGFQGSEDFRNKYANPPGAST